MLCWSVEGYPRWRIAKRYPGGVRDIAAKSGFPGDDDLAQTIEVADAATAADGLDFDDLGSRFWAWGEANGAGMGGLTHNVRAFHGGDAGWARSGWGAHLWSRAPID